jgi:copper transport protein
MPRRAARWRVALLAGLASAWLLLSCAPALAHATLVEASPARGGEVPEPPDRVELRFTEPVGAEFDPVVVRDENGARVDARNARVDPEDARVVLAGLEELPEGSYTVEWRVTSIDGHVVEGRYGFAVAAEGRPSGGDGSRKNASEPTAAHGGRHAGHGMGGAGGVASDDWMGTVFGLAEERAAGVAHGLALAATAFLAGLAPFVALVWLPVNGQSGVGRAAIRPLGALAWGLLVALAVAGVGELSSYAARASGGALSAELFSQALLDSRVGAVWIVRLGLALLVAASIAVAARSGRAWPWWAATGAGAVLLITLTGLSHAAATGRPLPLLADWTHAAAAAVWMGGLLGFAVALFSGTLRGLAPDLQAKVRERSVRRFSSVATTAVAVLACTGLYASVLHVPSPQALVATPYGRALLMKLALLTLLLAVGASNLLLRGRGPFGRLLVIELILALGLFAATGFLTSMPPPSGG